MTRLTEEMVIARSKQSDLSTIKKLNCWGSDLSDVSIIKRMRGVEVLALSVNKISTLQPFEDCIKLQELYLRKNNIQDINEIAYLQNLPALKYLWLEENPCCERAGPNYRLIVLQALPNLKKLDNVEVTPEEVEDAARAASNANSSAHRADDALCEDTYEPQQQQQQQKQQQHSHSQQHQQQYEQQSSPVYQSQHRSNFHQQQQSQQQQQPVQHYSARRSSSPMKEPSPGSDQESSLHAGYRERAPIPPSMSTHSMKEYYQSDRPAYPSHYRHSQTDLTEWEEHHQHSQYSNNASIVLGQRRSAGAERDPPERYVHRNGHSRENGDWEESERPKPRRPDGRFSDSASTVSAVLNHYTGYHRRPINRSSNLLSATLCLVKELDYSSLEVVEHAVRCRIDELADL